MSWKQNAAKVERVNRFGQTVDTPLFDQRTEEEIGAERRGVRADPIVPLPTRIYDGSETKAKIFQAIKDKLPGSRLRVFEAIFDLRTATDAEIADYLDWSINRVTPRRQELQQLGLISYVGDKNSEFGHPNSVWTVNATALRLLLG